MSDREPTQPIILRAGAVTTDRRLDRLPQWDARNGAFLVSAVLPKVQLKRPRGFTWSVPIWLDQGAEGACVGYSWSHELAARPRVVRDLTPEFALRVYHESQMIDPWPGGSYAGAEPFYEGTSVLAGAKVLQGWGHFGEYRWALDSNELAAAVGYEGPAVLGINWWTGMWEPDRDGFIHPTGQIAGGHAILCNRVNVREQFFGLHNSWGPHWGQNGTAKVSFEDMDKLLAENGEACVPMKRRKV